MRLLKQLELNGFKSFAQKTTFDLSHGITAIVGPNGSGKSNVIDAIRWLLGEREAKSLRGTKVEDLIFAGTAKRPRMGLAQASVHFENDGKFFPVDFSEITVTRKANRDGTNQYFLNRAEVRLKDIVDFFAKARLGTKGLVVVTQGNSDVFIRASQRERREMMEETLGLREYQIKKSDAERRLSHTDINLEKASALTEEILPHLRSLKRQTNRWEKREAMEKEMRELENRFFGSEFREIALQFAEADRAVETHNAFYAALDKERSAAEEHLAQIEAGQPAGRKDLQAVKQEMAKLSEQRGKLERELGKLEARLEMASQEPARATPERGALVALLKRIRVKLELALDNPDDLEKRVNDVLEEIDAAMRAPATISEEKPLQNDVSGSLDDVRKELAQTESRAKTLREKEADLEKCQEQFYAVFKKAVGRVERARDGIEKWETEGQRKKFERERVELRKEEWERHVRQAGRETSDFSALPTGDMVIEAGERRSMESRIFRLRGELAAIGEIDEAVLKEARETEARYEFLERQTADLTKAKTDLRRLIGELDEKIKIEFGNSLSVINEEFQKLFVLMFGGGSAKLKRVKRESPKPLVVGAEEGNPPERDTKAEARTDEPHETEEGIEIDLKLPRKRITSLDILSGGERSLVGIAALFALISVSPPPFLVLDEIDAALDERNARRFSEMLKEFSKKTQFVIVTHNRATMEAADVLYGVTMDADDTSKVVSLKLGSET